MSARKYSLQVSFIELFFVYGCLTLVKRSFMVIENKMPFSLFSLDSFLIHVIALFVLLLNSLLSNTRLLFFFLLLLLLFLFLRETRPSSTL